MGNLRRWILIFIASIFLFISLYLKNWVAIPGLQIHPGIYLSVCVAVLAEFALPVRLLTTLYYFGVSFGIVIISSLGFYSTAPIPNNTTEQVFSLIIQLGFSAWLIYLAHNISSAIQIFEDQEEIVRTIGIDDPSIDIQAARPLVHAELTRSRHYERPLSVLVMESLDLLKPGWFEELDVTFLKWFAGEYTRARFANTIKRELRAIDLVIKDPENQSLILVCPEIGAGNVHEVTRHLASIIQHKYGIQPRIASASFPDNGFSFEGLYQHAVENLHQLTTEDKESEMTAAGAQLGNRDTVYANK
jgi:hypothetical protein